MILDVRHYLHIRHLNYEITMAKNIVLVHGGFVDGAGWEGVYKLLKRDGYSVSVVQNPTISLEDDVAVTKATLATQDDLQFSSAIPMAER